MFQAGSVMNFVEERMIELSVSKHSFNLFSGE